MELSNRKQAILIDILEGSNSLPQLTGSPSIGEVTERTLQRDLSDLREAGIIKRAGEARATTYSVTPSGRINLSLPEERLERILGNEGRPGIPYDFSRLDTLNTVSLFTNDELEDLDHYNGIFQKKLLDIPQDILRRERERIAIELSWKSSQIEGNTYTLLETESLLKEGIPADGKTQKETQMVLNHKRALDFTEEHPELFSGQLDMQSIIELHRIIVEGLGISHALREVPIAVTGSAYKPLGNKFQIEEELRRFCDVVNAKQNVFEKAVLVFSFLCYLQPFNDGNKRTARILANALLFANQSFPLSLRAVSVNTYKLATLAYYEMGILGNIKDVFIGQAEFAADNYTI